MKPFLSRNKLITKFSAFLMVILTLVLHLLSWTGHNEQLLCIFQILPILSLLKGSALYCSVPQHKRLVQCFLH